MLADPAIAGVVIATPAETHFRLVEQALLAYTAGGAHQAGEDGRWGVLGPGARADLVVLGADPRAAEPLDIAGIPVLGTWLAGRQVFSA